MNILLVCAGGMSTSILMKKMEKFWAEKGVDLNIKAVGVSAYEENAKDFDVILMGPQVRYKLDEVKEKTGLPTEMINGMDYAMGNCENIFKQVEKMYK
ncbi:PTS sugar transporter subunit IIB [Anaerococcus sp. NML200574]|uniref:PTS sugar transporter subunit IIB n=1 Tax=Anaerococcus sp. NML200574 TaxID=2954486 RepID=UPI002237F027|nr:PTS sugar transporter subunit IIB [Anaerococcus sp. NML200574]MCW6679153.1 PTS sugar transporter subunit IIB [Anaerococcus sp. NML200574]